MQLEPLADEFYSYLTNERGASAKTIQAYRSDLKDFLSFLDDQGSAHDAETVTLQVARHYLAYLYARGLKPASIRRHIHGLRSMWSYLVDSDYLDRSPFRRIALPRKEQRVPVCFDPRSIWWTPNSCSLTLLEPLLLVLRRAHVTQARMKPLPIVEHFDVLEDIPPCFLPRPIPPVMYQLPLQRREEARQHIRWHRRLF